MSLTRYFQNERNALNNNGHYLNSDGTGGDNFYADEFTGADAGGAPVVQTSEPYVFSITNAATSAISSVEVLNSNKNYRTTDFGLNASITVAMGYSNVTYGGFLGQIMQKPFVCGAIYLASSTTNQVSESITLTHTDANGKVTQTPLLPFVAPNQYQSTVNVIFYNFTVDGYTALTFNSIYASATLNVRLYPANIADQVRGLVGQPVQQRFGNPNIIMANKMVVK